MNPIESDIVMTKVPPATLITQNYRLEHTKVLHSSRLEYQDEVEAERERNLGEPDRLISDGQTLVEFWKQRAKQFKNPFKKSICDGLANNNKGKVSIGKESEYAHKGF